MNYEQKYNEAFACAKTLHKMAADTGYDNTRMALEHIFPQLRESEDERIRKSLIRYFNEKRNCVGDTWGGFKCDAVIAYLEKLKDNTEKEYVFRPLAGTDITIAAKHAIEMAKDGDRLVLAFNGMYTPVSKYDSAKGLVDKYNTYLKEQKPAEWSEEEEALFGLLHQCVCRCVNDDRMIYSERERISKTMFPFIEKLQALRSQPKQEWSEEDKGLLLSVKCIIDEVWHSKDKFGYSEEELKEMWNWLDAAWQRLEYPISSWKPSEEDLDAIKELIDDANKRGWVTPGATRLYEQLKALM